MAGDERIPVSQEILSDIQAHAAQRLLADCQGFLAMAVISARLEDAGDWWEGGVSLALHVPPMIEEQRDWKQWQSDAQTSLLSAFQSVAQKHGVEVGAVSHIGDSAVPMPEPAKVLDKYGVTAQQLRDTLEVEDERQLQHERAFLESVLCGELF